MIDLSACLSVGLVDSGFATLASRIKDQGARGETAHDLLDECLAECGRELSAIGNICVGMGPGSFTGIRVCAALAEGLAFARRLPLFPFSSLAALAACPPPGSGPVAAAIAANGGRYFVRRPGQVTGGSGGGSPGIEALMSGEELEALAAESVVLVTAGHFPEAERFRSRFASLARFEETADFGRIARLARAAPAVTDGVLRPNYLMASAAEAKRRPAAGGPGAEATPR